MNDESIVKYKKSSHRSCHPKDTLEKISDITKEAGITRTSNITHLDRLDIPVYTSVRPMADTGAVSVYAGKGFSQIDAKVSSIMEAVERYSAEIQESDDIILKEYDPSSCINVDDLILPKNTTFKEIEWIKGYSIKDNKEWLIPANCVFHPYNTDAQRLFLSNTNGLASGNTIKEAIFHAMMEAIERDAWSFFEAYHKDVACIDCSNTKNEYIQNLLKKFNDNNISIKLLYLTDESIDIATVGAVSEDLSLKDSALITIGIGTHLDPEIAVIRAITEVAQSRATQIHGTREDTTRADLSRKSGYDHIKRSNNHWFKDHQNSIKLEDIPDKSTDSFDENINTTLLLLKDCGIDDAYYVDLTRSINIPVVRVIIPQLEVFCIDNTRVGKRLKPNYLL